MDISRLKLQFRALRDANWDERTATNHSYRFTDDAGEHLAIVDAVVEDNIKRSSRTMERQIRSSVKYWSRGLPG